MQFPPQFGIFILETTTTIQHILLLSTLVLFSAAVFAQQPEKMTVVTLNPDNSVTFRHRNPTVITVEVSGEFIKGAVQFRKVDGVWTYTTAPGYENDKKTIPSSTTYTETPTM